MVGRADFLRVFGNTIVCSAKDSHAALDAAAAGTLAVPGAWGSGVEEGATARDFKEIRCLRPMRDLE